MTDQTPVIAPHNAIWHGFAVLRLREGHIFLLAQHENICVVHYHPHDNSAPARSSSRALWKVASFVPVGPAGSARKAHFVDIGSWWVSFGPLGV
jgi:hypothetical protein